MASLTPIPVRRSNAARSAIGKPEHPRRLLAGGNRTSDGCRQRGRLADELLVARAAPPGVPREPARQAPAPLGRQPPQPTLADAAAEARDRPWQAASLEHREVRFQAGPRGRQAEGDTATAAEVARVPTEVELDE